MKDMALGYYLRMREEGCLEEAALFTNETLRQCEIEAEQLHRAALENSERIVGANRNDEKNQRTGGKGGGRDWRLVIFGQETEQFLFYRIPKVLFTDQRFSHIFTDAKVLYGVLLDRMNLSARNGWLDQDGRGYIIFMIEEILDKLSCGNKKAVSLLTELERQAELIERKR